MNITIEMAGIDYNRADITVRQRFSFTKSQTVDALQRIRRQEGILGCVVVATCNRTQLWVSRQSDISVDVGKLLCDVKHISYAEYSAYLEYCRGADAVEYLFELAAGLKSQILGEDQILTQIRESIDLSRQYYCSNTELEVLFRMAVTAGKEVRSQTVIPNGNSSAPLAAVNRLEEEGYSFAGRRCLVIGNGAMGKLTAELLRDREADVTVTVRQYRSGIVEIPPGVDRIDYGRRYEYIPQCDFVFSATASPNTTIRADELRKIPYQVGVVFVDLAVPRDMETELDELEGIRRLDMDYFQVDALSEETVVAVRQIQERIGKNIQEYIVWYESRDAVPLMLELSRAAARDAAARVGKPIRRAAPDQYEAIGTAIEQAVAKVVNKLLFSIRDGVDVETFRQCIDEMKKLYDVDSRKGSENADN